jgi:hypothetical protein
MSSSIDAIAGASLQALQALPKADRRIAAHGPRVQVRERWLSWVIGEGLPR